ncbi:DUF1015 family protein [Endozoicomonas sp. SM1973]|uniref:DUF1015 family protein n=1 Tax=Spartinivicinus marinus TaxID=2994442 RepID=A0A853I567_9GAMM|nr:DUF1015 family protein [Spartinivicinus marinus]MCX4029507.1 DUF1015 family protein [Spartinivicinus marinus]NYZ65081.1 DUF1015 family protein [Spartinivicinus marinus]
MSLIEQKTKVIDCNAFNSLLFQDCNEGLFIYHISGLFNDEPHEVIGVLSQYRNKGKSMVYPHEEIDSQRLAALQQEIVQQQGMSTPCYLVTNSKFYPRFTLSRLIQSAQPIISFKDKSFTHSIFYIHEAIDCIEVMLAINRIEHFLIADGHHRFAAYQQQTSIDTSSIVSLPVFITQTSETKVKSFGLVGWLNEHFNWQQLVDHCRQLGLKTCKEEQADFLIHYQNQKLVVAFDLLIGRKGFNQPGYHHNFILENLSSLNGVETISSEALAFQHKNHLSDINLSSHYLFIQTRSPSVESIYQSALQGHLLPKKSTCFLFKPLEGVIDFLQNEIKVAS